MVSKESMKRAILCLKMAFLMNVFEHIQDSSALTICQLFTFSKLRGQYDSTFSSFSFHDYFQLLLKIIHTCVESSKFYFCKGRGRSKKCSHLQIYELRTILSPFLKPASSALLPSF
jgi:hypothetical protein